jgi:hypothetical protein
MTTPRGFRVYGCAGLLLLALLCLAGCQPMNSRHDPGQPRVLSSPYPAQPVVVAVAPPINESGFSQVDVLRVCDAIVNQVQEVPGLMALPTNRVLGAMERLGLSEVGTAEEARTLARALGADLIIVTSITAWEPYEPFEIGFNSGVFAVTERAGAVVRDMVDPSRLRSAASDAGLGVSSGQAGPDAIASIHLNAADADVRALVSRYAKGRHDPQSALGSVRYLKAMRHYTQFATYHLVDLLLAAERQRVQGNLKLARTNAL